VSTLELRGVSVDLGGKRVVEDFDLTLRPGDVVALVGPNGAGKSTALRAAAGLVKPAAGIVTLNGKPLGEWRPGELAREMAVVAQAPVMPPLYAVRAMVALGRTPYLPLLGRESARDWAVVDEAMRRAGIDTLAGRRVGELSGGERQRVAIARALAQEPSILLLDEPTASLDLRYQDSTLSLVREMAADAGLACLVVLHDLALAGQFCDRVVLMSEGRIVAAGAPGDVLDPERLAEVYLTPLRAMLHPETGRPVIVHAGPKGRS
jgi:iron complex transport system ATP-binding protein